MKYGLILASLLLAGCNLATENSDGAAQEQVAAKYDNIDAANAQDFIIANPDAVVIDVRTPSEFAQGHIAGAINVDYKGDDFRDELAKLDKATHYVLHCKSGTRSGKSLVIMKELEFKHITHMDGGFDGWKAAQLPVIQ